ncbi:MAG: TetR/AcrR family transcriptional regulator [Firmicutes bacterium]|nr:TetR/AcrR family transcriptional regulator [Bacillota bacterium]
MEQRTEQNRTEQNRTEQNKRKREVTREKILSSAVSLFAERGLGMTSVKDIAKRAGVSVGLMYHYYKTKEEVFGELVKMSLLELKELQESFNSYDCPKEMLLRLTKDALDDMKTSREFAQWFAMFSHPLPEKHDPEWSDAFLNYHEEFIENVEKLIKRGQKENKFKEGDPTMMAQYYIAVIDGLCTLQLLLEEKFIVPSVEMLTAAIIKE